MGAPGTHSLPAMVPMTWPVGMVKRGHRVRSVPVGAEWLGPQPEHSSSKRRLRLKPQGTHCSWPPIPTPASRTVSPLRTLLSTVPTIGCPVTASRNRTAARKARDNEDTWRQRRRLPGWEQRLRVGHKPCTADSGGCGKHPGAWLGLAEDNGVPQPPVPSQGWVRAPASVWGSACQCQADPGLETSEASGERALSFTQCFSLTSVH